MGTALVDAPRAPATSYDEVPYQSHPFAQTHPDRLATVATLLGMDPPRVDRCRVLELGCAAGGNLIPLALTFPHSGFVGIDLSARQVEDGRKLIASLALDNIALKHLSIEDVGEEFGPFDYILCHGVFSWVPRPVQDKILEICRNNLAPNGVAYVSYNTYPGWHLHGMIRDMMCYHAARFAEPELKVRQARALLNFLAESSSQKAGTYGQLLREEVESIRKKADYYLLHEYLEAVNDPLYFHEFVARAAACGLRYLGEAALAVMAAHNFPPAVQQTLRRVAADQIHLEQYMDFLRNRTFRQTLLCREGAAVSYRLDPARVRLLAVSSQATSLTPHTDPHVEAPEQFRGPKDMVLTTREPVLRAALRELAAHAPQALPFEQLLDLAQARLKREGRNPRERAEDSLKLSAGLLHCYTSSTLVALCTRPFPFTAQVSARPVASPLARLQAVASDRVTNLCHEIVHLDPDSRQILRLLDGTRDHEALARVALTSQKPNGQVLCEDSTVALPQILNKLARAALLQA